MVITKIPLMTNVNDIINDAVINEIENYFIFGIEINNSDFQVNII